MKLLPVVALSTDGRKSKRKALNNQLYLLPTSSHQKHFSWCIIEGFNNDDDNDDDNNNDNNNNNKLQLS